MKFKSILSLTLTSLFIILPSFCFITSCASNDLGDDKLYFEYINDRTFSIIGPAVGQPDMLSLGSAWILDSIHDTKHPYEYYLMSNYHVMGAWIETQTPFLQFRFCSDISNSNTSPKPDCTVNAILNPKNDDEKYDEYLNDFNDNQAKYLKTSITNYRFDLAVFKYDFQNTLNDVYTNNWSKQKLKNRLDRLNEQSENNTQQITATCDEQIIFNSTNKFYYLGFPYSETMNSPIIKAKSFKISNYYRAQDNLSPYDGDKNIPSKPVYNSDEYLSIYDKHVWSGGSSGSMIINENFQVIGAHAGSRTYFFQDGSSTTFQRTVMFTNKQMQADYNFMKNFYNWRNF